MSGLVGTKAIAVILITIMLLPVLVPALSVTAAAPQLTGNFEEDVVAIGRWLEQNGVTEVKYTVDAAGDPNSVLRLYGLVEAAYRINEIWEAQGINVRVTVDGVYEADFKKAFDNFVSKYELGQNGDFFVNSYIYIATLAADERLLDITDWVNAYWDTVFSDFYTPLMEAAKYEGKYYGIPQDTEARPLYIRKDIAACMGWNLEGLDEKVKNGEFTWKDVYMKAKEAVDKGCAEWGLMHRKGSAHPDLIQFIFAYGGALYDPDTGKLVVDKEAIYKWFETERAFVEAGLLPSNILDWDWATQIHPTIVGEKGALFDIGGTWYWTEWQTKDYYEDPATGQKRPLTPEEVKEKFYYTLFPAGEPGLKPVTLSQPFMWMIAANAGKANPNYDNPEYRDAYQKLAFLLVVAASDPEINAIHSVISAHVPVRKAATTLLNDEAWVQKLANLEVDLAPEVKDAISDIVAKTVDPINVQFLASVGYMLEYTKLASSHPYYSKLAGIFKDALDQVLKGQATPEEAVNYIVAKVRADPNLRDTVEIKGEIPKDWKFMMEMPEQPKDEAPAQQEQPQQEEQAPAAEQPAEQEQPAAEQAEEGGLPTAAIVLVVIIILAAAAFLLRRRG